MDVYARRRLVAVLAIVLVLVLIVVAVAGGGGDEDSGSITTDEGASTPGVATPLSKDEFIQEGDAICEETAISIASLSDGDEEQLATDELSLTEAQLDSLRSLTPPEEDQATLDDFFAAHEDLVAGLESKVAATRDADTTASTNADTDISLAQDELLDAAEAYGFEECGDPDAGSTRTEDDSGSVAPSDPTGVPAAPTEPAPVEPAPVEPAPAPAPAPAPDDSGGTDGGGGGGSGGISP